MKSRKNRIRHGVIAVETAFILPVFVVFLFGTMIGGLGVFRFLQLSALSRESSRYVVVRGHEWEKATGNTSPTTQEVFQNVVLPRAMTMSVSQLSLQIDWINGETGAIENWDSSTKSVRTANTSNVAIANKARVTLTCQWMPEFFWMGPIQMSSVSELPMTN